MPVREDKQLIDDKIRELRKRYTEERSNFALNTNFRIKRYNFDKGWIRLVKKGLDIYPNNLDKILLLNFEIRLIKAKPPQVQTNKLWKPIKKSVIANANKTKGMHHIPKKIGK